MICHDFFHNFLSFLCNVLRVSSESDPSRRDRSVSVPAESAAETATLNHVEESSNTGNLGIMSVLVLSNGTLGQVLYSRRVEIVLFSE